MHGSIILWLVFCPKTTVVVVVSSKQSAWLLAFVCYIQIMPCITTNELLNRIGRTQRLHSKSLCCCVYRSTSLMYKLHQLLRHKCMDTCIVQCGHVHVCTHKHTWRMWHSSHPFQTTREYYIQNIYRLCIMSACILHMNGGMQMCTHT